MRQTATVTAPDPALISAAAEMARFVLKHRRRRAEQLGHDLFTDPAWDIMLILMSEGQTDSACTAETIVEAIGSSVSLSSIGRWLSLLEERNLVLRDAGQVADRPAYCLSPSGLEALISLMR